VAEIAFDPDPINTGTQPYNSDKFAQRNISWSTVANPGINVSRQALQTFEVRPTPSSVAPGQAPDELMIDWDNIPAGQIAEIYIPEVNADEVISKANRLYKTHRITKQDQHTIRVLTGGISYIPLPAGSGNGLNFTGLLSVSLPSGIKRGQLYKVIVYQLTNAQAGIPVKQTGPAGRIDLKNSGYSIARWRDVHGTFQVNIPVSTKELMLEKEELRLSIFRWIAQSIQSGDRWYLVFQRWLYLLGIKVSELGGNPGKIKPSRNGYDGLPGFHQKPGEHKGEHKKEGIDFTGKVESVLYDRFGDFEGFTLRTEEGYHHSFRGREHEIELLVYEAWLERIVITVVVSPHDRHWPSSIIYKRPPDK
jgi:hypothetical protein